MDDIWTVEAKVSNGEGWRIEVFYFDKAMADANIAAYRMMESDRRDRWSDGFTVEYRRGHYVREAE